MTLWSVLKAMQTHNIQYISQDMDWYSIKNQLKVDLIKEMDLNPPSSDDLPEFGNSFASTSIKNAVDLHIGIPTIQHILKILIPSTPQSQSSSIDMAFLAFQRMHISYLSPFTIRAKVTLENQKEPLFITLKLKQWRWKITSITLPSSVMESLLNGSEP